MSIDFYVKVLRLLREHANNIFDCLINLVALEVALEQFML